ncbi:MAG: IS66 family transposase [Bacteroidota bacterium]|nr:IS66 family transposase [Bacteroidota bacterium]
MTPNEINLTPEELDKLIERLSAQSLQEGDHLLLINLIKLLAWMCGELQEKKLSIARLQKVFGIKTESAKALLELAGQQVDKDDKDTNSATTEKNDKPGKEGKKKKRKQKRTSASDYKSAKIIKIGHETLKAGMLCPECGKGKLRVVNPGKVIRIVGQPWLQAEIYEQERFRCNTCGKTFTACLHKDVATAPKYDKTAKAIVAILKYRGGFPFYRQEKLQEMLETPISDTQLWEMTRDISESLEPVHEALIAEAASGECIHNDDTKARVLSLMKENKENAAKNKNERTGIFTSAILSVLELEIKIALYFTGRQHAGENLNDVLDERPEEKPPPIQMCDALPQNNPVNHETKEGNCLAHLRRKFYETAVCWPAIVLQIITWFNEIFFNEQEAKKLNLDNDARLKWHQEKSKLIMDKIKIRCNELLEKKEVEPNSSLGKAVAYLNNHWSEFTLFLREPGVPLDNNACERMIKQSVLNRKNGYFFKTENGSKIGDVILSAIETCQLNEVNPYNYLVAVQTYPEDVSNNPRQWFPWNYHERFKVLEAPQGEAVSSPTMTASS